MSDLSESQRLRAEQNRLKALQIRQQKLGAQGCSRTPQFSGPPQSTPGAPQSHIKPPEVTPPPPQSRIRLPDVPPPPKPSSGTVSTPTVPQAQVGASKFYTPPSSSSGNIKTTPGNSQPRFIPPQAGVRPGGGESEPPNKYPKTEVMTPNQTTSGLSSEVLMRIEESKRKAQERRQQALRKAREQSLGTPPVPAASKVIPSFRPQPKPVSQPVSQPVQPSTSDTKNATAPAAPKGSRVVTVNFMLASVKTFRANTSMFHAATIQVFKTMTSRIYDYNARVWSFNISEHKKLVAALKPLQPEVEVQPLPQFVVTAVEAAVKKVPAECIDLFGLDARLLDALMPFQVEGVKFGMSLGGRVMLADDMGLGKTIQALGIACHYKDEWPLLVVTPSSMRYSWEESIIRWVGSVSSHEIQVMATGNDNFRDAQVVVTSYDLLSRKAEVMLQHNFGVVIFDESHMIKSYKSARYKAAAPLMKKMKRVIMLSGTPAMSRPMELYTQISGIDPSLFPNFQDYGVRYCEGRKEAWGWSFRGSSNTDELQTVLQSCVWIRRLKSEVLSQLPPKQRMTVVLDPALIKTSTKNFKEMAQKFQFPGSSLLQEGDHLQLFVKTAEAKVLAVREYLKEVLVSGKKFLVFAHHKLMIESLCCLCKETKTKYIKIDGRTSAEERMANTTKFQQQEEVRVAVLSITAASTGITLTAAQLVIFAELYWNPGVLVQAEDRAHRIGQKDSVMVQYLVARKTADDHIWPMIQSKLEVLGKVGLSDDKLDNSNMSFQKSVAEPDIRDFMTSGETARQISPTKAATTSDIRDFLQPQDQTEDADPNWNL